MLPEHFYFTGAGWFGYVFYVPLALGLVGLLYAFVVRKIRAKLIRWPVLVILVTALITAPLWQALSISYQAEKLCKEQGGMHVYKIVETEGFIGGLIQDWSKYGFKFTEGTDGKNKYRWSITNYNVNKENIQTYQSHYEVIAKEKLSHINRYIKRTIYQVIDNSNEEILGEFIYLSIYPSEFDAFSLSLLPVENSLWICGIEAPQGKGSYSSEDNKYIYHTSDLIKAVLKPVVNTE